MEKIFNKLDRYFCNQWHVGVLDMDIGRWFVDAKASNIAYLKAVNADGKHILIQPGSCHESHFLLADDLNHKLIDRHHKAPDGKWKPGRMVVETSDGNFQVWIHSSRPVSLEEKRYWLKRLNSDPGADPNNRWGRCPGFRNRKDKHRDQAGGYPLAKLIWIDWKRRATIPVINSVRLNSERLSPQPPGGEVCHQKISRSDYQRGNESATDFAYALALFRRGHDCQFVRESILMERVNWKNHSGQKRIQSYIERTINRAQQIVRSEGRYFNGNHSI